MKILDYLHRAQCSRVPVTRRVTIPRPRPVDTARNKCSSVGGLDLVTTGIGAGVKNPRNQWKSAESGGKTSMGFRVATGRVAPARRVGVGYGENKRTAVTISGFQY